MSTPTFLSLVRRTATALLLALLASCGGGSGSDPTPAAPVATEGSATVDASGGTVAGPDGVSLLIPAEALDASTTVRIARDSGGAPELLGMTLASPIYAVTPHGTTFTTSALLKLPFDASKIPNGATPVVLRGEPDGTWHVQPLTSTQPGIAAVDVSSLSWYAVGVCTPGDAGVFGFGIGDCPANSTLKLEYRDGKGTDIPVSRNAKGLALPFPEITTPTDITLHFLWERPAGIDREDEVFLISTLGWPIKGEVVNQQVYSRDVQVHIDPTQVSGAARPNGTVVRFYATAQFCRRNVLVFGVGNRDVCWSFDTDIAFRVHDTNLAPSAPVITEQPANASVIAGQRVTYRVSATAPSPLYTWWQRFNPTSGNWQYARLERGNLGSSGESGPPLNASSGTQVAGGPGVLVTVDNSTPGTVSSIVNGTQSFSFIPDASDVGARFRVLVCDGFASGNLTCTYSKAAVLDYLTDGKKPWWTLEPADTHVPAGTTASFTVNANGYYLAPSVAIHVKTPAGSESIHPCPYAPGSNPVTSCTHTTGVVGAADTGTTVWAEAWIDQAKTSIVTSRTATLTVSNAAAAPSISSQPVATTATVGGTASFSVGAGGTAPLSYQWRFNGAPLTDHSAGSGTSGVAGSGSATLVLTNVQSGDAGNYSVVVGNGTTPDATSNGAALSISQRSAAAMRLALGGAHSCAVKQDNSVACWGENLYGQMGDGSSTDRPAPTAVIGIGDIVQLAAGAVHTCGLRSDGSMVCWGGNSSGQLGHGDTVQASQPYATSADLPLTGLTAIVGGNGHTCAVQQDSRVLCWGNNVFGQLGDGTLTAHSLPTAVPGLSGVVSLAAGWFHTCAARSDGRVLCWGWNNSGQLGDGTGVGKSVPTLVPNLTGVVTLSAGPGHTCALKSDHTVACWGSNNHGQLGNSSMFVSSLPVAVPGLTDVASLGMGNAANHSCAVKSNGSLWCWGLNSSGQLGDGSPIDQLPMAVPGLTNVVSVAMGSGHTCAFKTNATVLCWGLNNYGQLGDGSTVQRFSPTLVAF